MAAASVTPAAPKRRLRDRLGPSPAECLEAECAALRADPTLSDLPERISIFGPTPQLIASFAWVLTASFVVNGLMLLEVAACEREGAA